MTKDDIIRMAQVASELGLADPFENGFCVLTQEELEHFAALVAAHEREACARVCEQSDEEGEGPDSWGWHSKDYAKAIRASGNT